MSDEQVERIRVTLLVGFFVNFVALILIAISISVNS
jgi:hypothetical protein